VFGEAGEERRDGIEVGPSLGIFDPALLHHHDQVLVDGGRIAVDQRPIVRQIDVAHLL